MATNPSIVAAVTEPSEVVPSDSSRSTQEDGEKSESLPEPAEKAGDPSNVIVHDSSTDENTENSSAALNWSYRYKISIVILISLMTMVDVMATITCVPAVPKILESFGSTSGSYSVLLVSIWEAGEGIGPFLVAPLSEIFGRLPVYHVFNILFLLCSVAGALSINLSMLVFFRFLNGFTVACLTLGPAMVGDMFVMEQRGTPMALLFAGPLIGPVAGPIIGGYVADTLGWRWTYWIITIAVGVVLVLSIVFMRETRKPKWKRSKVDTFEEQTQPSPHPRQTFANTMLMPFRMLLFNPVVLVFSIYVGIEYGFLYVILTTLTEVLENTYHFTASDAGLAFLSMGIGMIFGVVLCGVFSDRYMKSKGANARPEHRLPILVAGSAVLPVALFMYGWTASSHVHWIAPLIGTGLVGFAFIVTEIPAQTYIVDAYSEHSASAVAALSFTKTMFGTLFPLVGPPLYDRLGLGWGNSLLAFIGIALIAVPASFLKWGHLWRQRFDFSG